MKPCNVPPGDDPAADAYNLTYCAWIAQYRPASSSAAERMVKTISARVTDWEAVAANLALIAAMGFDFTDQAFSGRPEVPSEAMRTSIEADNLIPA